MKRVVLLIVVLLFSLSILAGCSQHLGNFTALSTANFRAENIKSENLVAKDAKGGASSLIIFGIPIGGQPKVDQAVAEALSENNGDFMQNARLYYKWWMWPFPPIGEMKYEVQGDVYKTQK